MLCSGCQTFQKYLFPEKIHEDETKPRVFKDRLNGFFEMPSGEGGSSESGITPLSLPLFLTIFSPVRRELSLKGPRLSWLLRKKLLFGCSRVKGKVITKPILPTRTSPYLGSLPRGGEGNVPGRRLHRAPLPAERLVFAGLIKFASKESANVNVDSHRE